MVSLSEVGRVIRKYGPRVAMLTGAGAAACDALPTPTQIPALASATQRAIVRQSTQAPQPTRTPGPTLDYAATSAAYIDSVTSGTPEPFRADELLLPGQNKNRFNIVFYNANPVTMTMDTRTWAVILTQVRTVPWKVVLGRSYLEDSVGFNDNVYTIRYRDNFNLNLGILTVLYAHDKKTPEGFIDWDRAKKDALFNLALLTGRNYEEYLEEAKKRGIEVMVLKTLSVHPDAQVQTYEHERFELQGASEGLLLDPSIADQSLHAPHLLVQAQIQP